MPPVGFEPTIAAGERLKTYALDRAATGTGTVVFYIYIFYIPDDDVYLLTYLLTPWSRVLLEKLTSYQLVKKFPTFYGTRRFIAAVTSYVHMYFLIYIKEPT